jgi:prepilin-type N-terminal cleavage/methylation domain-containing protein
MSDFFALRRNAFTLVEVAVVIVILGIVAALIAPNFSNLRKRAEGIVCTAHLRSLWTEFSTQLNDGGSWPQKPESIPIGSHAEQQWWLDYSSNSMSTPASEWHCPTMMRLQRANKAPRAEENIISYWPTLFSANKAEPRLSANYVWIAEMGNFHGAGPLSVRADGSVRPLQDP